MPRTKAAPLKPKASPSPQAGDHLHALRPELASIDSLKIDPNNARNHGEANIAAVMASFKAFGQDQPLVVRRVDRTIVKGHGRLDAMKRLGWTECAVVFVDDDDATALARAIADNRTAELATWNTALLRTSLEELQVTGLLDTTGFQLHDLEALQLEKFTPSDAPIPQPLAGAPVTVDGEVWTLGPHRLVCGDCTNARDMAMLMNGRRATVIVTSPPYASQRKYDESSEFKPIKPEDYVAWFAAVQAGLVEHLAGDGSFFLNIKEHCEEGERHLYVKDLTIAMVRTHGWFYAEEFAWTHTGTPRAVVNRFKNCWEPVFHFTRAAGHKFRPDNVTHETDTAILGFKLNGSIGKSGHPAQEKKQGQRFTRRKAKQAEGAAAGGRPGGEGMGGMQGIGDAIGARDDGRVGPGRAYPGNVLSVGRNTDALGHSAAFPPALPSFFIRAYSDQGDAVLDPFGGSGSTMIAAHELGRDCLLMEISPAYCDLIIRRWQEFAKLEAVDQSGRTFNSRIPTA